MARREISIPLRLSRTFHTAIQLFSIAELSRDQEKLLYFSSAEVGRYRAIWNANDALVSESSVYESFPGRDGNGQEHGVGPQWVDGKMLNHLPGSLHHDGPDGRRSTGGKTHPLAPRPCRTGAP